MIPCPPIDVSGPATNFDDSTPMGSSTALTFVKPKKDRTKSRPAGSVNKSSTNAPPDATPLAERINATKPHAFARSQSPLPVPGMYGSETCAPPIEHGTHRAFHLGGRGRNSHLLAEDIRPGTPERTRLGTSFRSIERLRLDAANLQRARSPMLPPPVPASAARQPQPQPQSADASDPVINLNVPHSAEVLALTENSGERNISERDEDQNVSWICWSDRVLPLITFLQEGGYILGEESVESPLAQGFQEASTIAAPQTVTEQTPLIEYLVAHAEESAQAEKRWKDASVDEWKAGAQGPCIRVTIYSIV